MGDVARRAGLSRAQVSNFFNNPTLVSADASARIRAAVAQLGYVRDEAASALRRGSTRMLGLLLLDGWAPYFADLSQAVDDEAHRRGWYLQVANSSRDEDRELRHLNHFEAYRTRGIIVAPQGDVSLRLQQLTDRGMACVLLDPPHHHGAPPSIPSVRVDHRAGGALAAEHLLDRGCRRLAFVGSTVQVHSRDRLAGFRSVVARRPDVASEVVETPELTMGGGGLAAERIVRRAPEDRPDGVLAANDLVAVGLLHALTAAGVRVPEDVGVVGYDDIDMAAQLVTPLTTVRQPVGLLGTTAVGLVVDQIEGSAAVPAPHVTLRPELVVRAST